MCRGATWLELTGLAACRAEKRGKAARPFHYSGVLGRQWAKGHCPLAIRYGIPGSGQKISSRDV